MERGLSKKGINLHSSVVVMFVFMAAILTDSLSHGQVGVEPNRALLKEGESADLLCRYGKSINYCRIEIPGEKVLNLSPNWNKTPGFKYYGHGLTAGQCGVTIEHASAKHNGLVKCSLGVEGEEEVGTIDLVVALSPEQPLIELLSKPERDGSFVEGTQLQARCIVRNGRPAANISWLVDGLPADKRMSDSEVIESPIDGNNIVYTTIGKIQWHLTPEDNGRKLICRSHHQTRDQDAVYQILVRYAPIKQPEVLVYGLYLEQTAMVNITIRANPSPVIEWNIDGLPIVPGDRNERYSAYEPRYLGKDLYNITLAIAGLTLEDTTKSYLLKASNALGLQEYTVRISSSSTPPSAGLDVGSIVGIVVALAILIVIVMLIIFARATGRWCFGGKSIKSPTSETTTITAISTEDRHHSGQNVSLLEIPNGVAILGSHQQPHQHHQYNHHLDQETSTTTNGHDRLSVVPRTHDIGDDDSFEYATDRESSGYNPTSAPAAKSIMGSAGGRNSQKNTSDADSASLDNFEATTTETDTQRTIPESRFSRWIPKDQREILEKQAKLLANRFQPKPFESHI